MAVAELLEVFGARELLVDVIVDVIHAIFKVFRSLNIVIAVDHAVVE